jgi:arylsulfatase A-like enzyme
LTEAEWRDVVSSHYATISYVDWCVGKVLDAIRSTGREENTIVILWSDHGFMLGEHFLWRKVNLYEESARVAFVWKVPGLTPAGARCARPVETIDTFPTLFDLCGIPQPKGVEGMSMKPLLKDPARPWKKGAITWRAGNGNQVSIQTEHFRLNKRVDTGFLELYDHRVDPREFKNVAKDPAYAADVDRLSALLEGDWKACLPEES